MRGDARGSRPRGSDGASGCLRSSGRPARGARRTRSRRCTRASRPRRRPRPRAGRRRSTRTQVASPAHSPRHPLSGPRQGASSVHPGGGTTARGNRPTTIPPHKWPTPRSSRLKISRTSIVGGCREPPAPSSSSSRYRRPRPVAPPDRRRRRRRAAGRPVPPGRRAPLDPGPRGVARPLPGAGRRGLRRARRCRVRHQPGRLGCGRRSRAPTGPPSPGPSPTCTLPRAGMPTGSRQRDPARWDLRPGRPDTSLVDPAAWRRAWRAAGSVVPGNDAGAGPPHARLRRVLAEHLRRSRGVAVAPDDLLLVPGVGASLRALPPASAWSAPRWRSRTRATPRPGPRSRPRGSGWPRCRSTTTASTRRCCPGARSATYVTPVAPVPAGSPDAGDPPGAAPRVGPAHRRPGARGRLRRRVPLRRVAAAGPALAARREGPRRLHRHGIQAGGPFAAGRLAGATAPAARPAAGRARLAGPGRQRGDRAGPGRVRRVGRPGHPPRAGRTHLRGPAGRPRRGGRTAPSRRPAPGGRRRAARRAPPARRGRRPRPRRPAGRAGPGDQPAVGLRGRDRRCAASCSATPGCPRPRRMPRSVASRRDWPPSTGSRRRAGTAARAGRRPEGGAEGTPPHGPSRGGAP